MSANHSLKGSESELVQISALSEEDRDKTLTLKCYF